MRWSNRRLPHNMQWDKCRGPSHQKNEMILCAFPGVPFIHGIILLAFPEAVKSKLKPVESPAIRQGKNEDQLQRRRSRRDHALHVDHVAPAVQGRARATVPAVDAARELQRAERLRHHGALRLQRVDQLAVHLCSIRGRRWISVFQVNSCWSS